MEDSDIMLTFKSSNFINSGVSQSSTYSLLAFRIGFKIVKMKSFN
jgi:hypothetical protein